ncbi:MAG: hypothetical protein Q9166_007706 [cf. Caloplaca sp. 2 TL-2023]
MPLLSRGVDALWEALCPTFYKYPLSYTQHLRKLAKTVSARCFCTTPRPSGSKIRFIRKNAPPWRGKRHDDLEKENASFFNGQEISVNACGQVAGAVDESRDSSEKQTWHSLWRKVSDRPSQRPTSPRESIERSHTQEPEESASGETPDYHERLPIQEEPQGKTANCIPRLCEPIPKTVGIKSSSRRDNTVLLDGELYEELRRASTAGDYPRIREVLKILIKDRGVKPDRRHYQSLLLANTSPQHGSPGEVARILNEMEIEGIALDSAAYHAILRVLAIHPDYLSRKQVLEELGERWFTLSNEGWHDVIIGLLRDKQLELAIETLQSVQQEGIRVQPWLYDMLIFNLCDIGEHDEALSILRFRIDNGEELISGTVWHYLLDSASSAFHHAATLFAWRKRVAMSYLNPSFGICLNVLNTAARHGDFRLATDVVRVLGNRKQTLQLHHYEALIEAHLPSELRTAFTLLALMTSSGRPPAVSTTRVIFLHLRRSPHLPDIALSMLGKMARQARSVPAEAVNVVIEAYIYHDKFDQALDTYKTLHTLCPSGPVTNTFNTLFRGCRSRKDTAMFLASEMVALKVAPDALTYDRLILVCLESGSENGNVEDAWRYVEEMRGIGWWPRPGTAMALAKKCCSMGDKRIWRLQGDDYGENGIARSVIERMVDKAGMDPGKGKGRRGNNMGMTEDQGSMA